MRKRAAAVDAVVEERLRRFRGVGVERDRVRRRDRWVDRCEKRSRCALELRRLTGGDIGRIG